MIFLNVKINNMFGIKEVNLDLTYPRKTPVSPIDQYLKEYNGINYKKIYIIMGANASGKTSLARSFCYIQNFLLGHTLHTKSDVLSKVHLDRNETFGFSCVFCANDFIYSVEVEFDKDNLVSEKWKKIALFPTITNSVLNKRLSDSEYIYTYNIDTHNLFEVENQSNIIFEHKSSFLSNVKFKKDKQIILDNNMFYYRFSGKQFENVTVHKMIDLEFFKNILQSFDSSIVSVESSKDDVDEILIKFQNGVTERLIDNRVSSNSILSSGTQEAIGLAMILYEIMKKQNEGIYFIDEQMAFSHSDIESTIIKLILTWVENKDTQIFITSHNKSILDIGLPAFNYTLLRRNEFTNDIEVINPENSIVHKSRSLKSLIEKDIFSISPSFEKLLDLVD